VTGNTWAYAVLALILAGLVLLPLRSLRARVTAERSRAAVEAAGFSVDAYARALRTRWLVQSGGFLIAGLAWGFAWISHPDHVLGIRDMLPCNLAISGAVLLFFVPPFRKPYEATRKVEDIEVALKRASRKRSQS
jgi:hypothetical protein